MLWRLGWRIEERRPRRPDGHEGGVRHGAVAVGVVALGGDPCSNGQRGGDAGDGHRSEEDADCGTLKTRKNHQITKLNKEAHFF